MEEERVMLCVNAQMTEEMSDEKKTYKNGYKVLQYLRQWSRSQILLMGFIPLYRSEIYADPFNPFLCRPKMKTMAYGNKLLNETEHV